MGEAIQNVRSLAFPSTVRASCLVRTVLVIFLLGLVGCAVKNYSPPLLPTFMQEQLPAGLTPPAEQDTPSWPAALVPDDGPARTGSVTLEPRATGSSPIAETSASERTGEELSQGWCYISNAALVRL
jgi:hypothetical protein